MEDEQWNPAEVSPSLQRITDVLVDSAVRDSPELVIKSDTDTLFPSSNGMANGTANPIPNTNGKGKGKGRGTTPPPAPVKQAPNGFNPASAAGSKHLRIDERTYFAVSATAEVLVLLLDYLRVVVNLSLLTTDTMGRVIEFLKAFNSRTCQVVLGAGAMRSAGLKNITAKHLGEWVLLLWISILYVVTEECVYLYSACVAVAFDHVRAHPICEGDFQTAP